VRRLRIVIEDDRAGQAGRTGELEGYAVRILESDLADVERPEVAPDAAEKRVALRGRGIGEHGRRVRLRGIGFELLGCAIECADGSVDALPHRWRLRG